MNAFGNGPKKNEITRCPSCGEKRVGGGKLTLVTINDRPKFIKTHTCPDGSVKLSFDEIYQIWDLPAGSAIKWW